MSRQDQTRSLLTLAAYAVVIAAAVGLNAPVAADDDRTWAFRPPVRPEIPRVQNSEWIRTPVDAFVLAKLEQAGLDPSRQADRQTLARRLYFDLTGLPPTSEQMDAFLADDSPDSYERLVEQLLASPHHGQRWAQHWLDVVRYADSDGFEYDDPRPHAWRYRDWVIEALNSDKPFDRFVKEQIAADELYPGDRDALAALVLGCDDPQVANVVLLGVPPELAHAQDTPGSAPGLGGCLPPCRGLVDLLVFLLSQQQEFFPGLEPGRYVSGQPGVCRRPPAQQSP